MAVFTRTNGNAQNVMNVGNGADFSTATNTLGNVVSVGVGKPLQCWSINSNVAMTAQVGTGQAVESILRTVGLNATILAYQVGSAGIGGVTNGLVSVITEDSAWNATDLQANVVALGTDTNGYNYTGIKVANAGLKFVTTAGA
jgi:hypothetical protein